MKQIHFFLPDYPDWTTGGNKYHTILFEYFKKSIPQVYSFGHHKFTQYVESNKLLKILFGFQYTYKIPRNSIIITTNTSFLHCFIPVLLNNLYKRHFYFLIIHHLVCDEKPSYLRKKLEDYFIKKADKVITVSATTQKRLYDLKLGLNNIEVFNPGLDVSKIEGNIDRKLHLKSKLLFVGTIEQRKGIIYLIKALNLISGEYELNIIGEESNSKDYYELILDTVKQNKLEDKVFFRGKVSREELRNYFINSSIFVFPSLWEGYGMVIAEAMAYGLPIVATRIKAIEELINDGLTGLLVDTKNSEQLAEKINLLLKDKTLADKLSENAYKKAQSFPSWDDTSEKILKVITKIM